MRILYLVPYTPTRIRTRPFNLLRSLHQRGHRITLATLWNNPSERAVLDQLAGEGIDILAAPFSQGRALANCLAALPRPTPLQAVYSWEPALAQQVVRAMTDPDEPFDVLHVEHLRGARSALWIRHALRKRGRTIPVVWDSVDCISHLFQQAARQSKSHFGQLVARLELSRTRRYEPWLVEQFDRTLVTGEQDRRALLELLDSSFVFRPSSEVRDRIRTLPNGVDLDYFKPLPIERNRDTLILSGKMSYHANVTAARYLVDEIMPQVWKQLPDVQVEIVGAQPTREVLALERQFGDHVSVTGEVPDLRVHLARATLAAAPIVYGAGIQNKVLEAMAMATPVVATPQAVAALSVHEGKDVQVGRTATEFAGHVVHLFRDRLVRARQGDNGREYVETEHDWKRAAEKLEDIYRELAPGRRAKVRGGMSVR